MWNSITRRVVKETRRTIALGSLNCVAANHYFLAVSFNLQCRPKMATPLTSTQQPGKAKLLAKMHRMALSQSTGMLKEGLKDATQMWVIGITERQSIPSSCTTLAQSLTRYPSRLSKPRS